MLPLYGSKFNYWTSTHLDFLNNRNDSFLFTFQFLLILEIFKKTKKIYRVLHYEITFFEFLNYVYYPDMPYYIQIEQSSSYVYNLNAYLLLVLSKTF